MSETLTGKHLIAGEWAEATGEAFQAANAKTGEWLPTVFREAGPDEANAAFAAATSAFERIKPMPATRRAELLEAIATSIQGRETVLIAQAGLETALPEARLKGELARTTSQLKMFAVLLREGSWVDAVIDTADPARQPLPKPDVRRMQRPLGPVVVFGASNFPFAFGTCGGDTASALAAGCPVIVKGHHGHPGTNELFGQAVREALESAQFPPGTFALLQGQGTEIGKRLVLHPAAEAVGFTGSQRGGRALFDLGAARPRPIPVYAEMGSVNPLVILPGALAERLDAIVDGLATSITMGGGQFCTKPGLIFVIDGPNVQAFAEGLAKKLQAMAAATLLNAGIQQKFTQTLAKMAQHPAVTVSVQGAASGHADHSPSLLAVEAADWRDSDDLQEEAFGPASLLIGCKDEAELLMSLAATSGNLTGAIHYGEADTLPAVQAVALTLEPRVGRLLFNGYPTGVEVCHAMVHGGPYPATTAPGTTSVGTLAIQRFVRPVAFQNMPDALLPAELQNANPLGLWRLVDGQWTQKAL